MVLMCTQITRSQEVAPEAQVIRCFRDNLEDITPQELSITSNITILMTTSESVLFWRYLSGSSRYFEFGSGGSTELASLTTNLTQFATVDSDVAFTTQLIQGTPSLLQALSVGRMLAFHADIGPIREFGHPLNADHKHQWRNYPQYVLKMPWTPDLVLVDGRFRVASTLFALLAVSKERGFVLIHDFFSRPHYHALLDFVETVDCVHDLLVVRPRLNIDWVALLRTIDQYLLDSE